MQFVEQLFLTRETKSHMEQILQDHPGSSTSDWIASMKSGGVDQNGYHSGSIDGNHCMNFANSGVDI